VQETTALGAAYRAGLAEGLGSGLDEVASHWSLDVEVAPSLAAARADADHARWRTALDRSRGWEPAAPT